jgi:hypothetical protein
MGSSNSLRAQSLVHCDWPDGPYRDFCHGDVKLATGPYTFVPGQPASYTLAFLIALVMEAISIS